MNILRDLMQQRSLRKDLTDSYEDEDNLYKNLRRYIEILEMNESILINSDEIAAHYYKEVNAIVSLFHKSITNLMNVFGFSFARMYQIRGGTSLEIYVDDYGNEAWINYKVNPIVFTIIPDNSTNEIQIVTSAFYIDPEIEISYACGIPASIIHLQTFVELFKDNEFSRTTDEYLKLYAKHLETPEYIV